MWKHYILTNILTFNKFTHFFGIFILIFIGLQFPNQIWYSIDLSRYILVDTFEYCQFHIFNLPLGSTYERHNLLFLLDANCFHLNWYSNFLCKWIVFEPHDAFIENNSGFCFLFERVRGYISSYIPILVLIDYNSIFSWMFKHHDNPLNPLHNKLPLRVLWTFSQNLLFVIRRVGKVAMWTPNHYRDTADLEVLGPQ